MTASVDICKKSKISILILKHAISSSLLNRTSPSSDTVPLDTTVFLAQTFLLDIFILRTQPRHLF